MVMIEITGVIPILLLHNQHYVYADYYYSRFYNEISYKTALLTAKYGARNVLHSPVNPGRALGHLIY